MTHVTAPAFCFSGTSSAMDDLILSKQPLVSVVVPTHNRPAMLTRAVESALSQTYDNLEVIIVDDRSGEATARAANMLAQSSKVRYYRSNGRGACAARNLGIQVSSGEFVTGLDDDDLFTPQRIERLLAAYDDQYAFVAARSATFVDEVLPSVDESIGRVRVISMRKLLDSNRIGNQALVRRDRLLTVGGFDEKLRARQDYDLWVRLVERFGPAKLITNVLYLRNESPDYDRISKSENRRRGVVQFYKKHRHRMSFKQNLKTLSLITKKGED